MYYRIQSHVNASGAGPTLYLSLDNNNLGGGLVVNAQDNDDSQLWQPVMLINTSNNRQGIVLRCKRLVNNQQVVIGFGNGSAAAPVNLNGADMGKVCWNLKLPALQYAGNTDWNLNVSGNGPYKPGNAVLIWDWSNGQPNETWTLVPADFQP